MEQTILEITVRASTFLIIVVGSLGVLTLLVAAMWKLVDYLFRSTKSVVMIIEYARYRKDFKKWKKENPSPIVYKPRVKERDAK